MRPKDPAQQLLEHLNECPQRCDQCHHFIEHLRLALATSRAQGYRVSIHRKEKRERPEQYFYRSYANAVERGELEVGPGDRFDVSLETDFLLYSFTAPDPPPDPDPKTKLKGDHSQHGNL